MKIKANENKFFPVIFNLFCCHAVRYEYFDNSYFNKIVQIYKKNYTGKSSVGQWPSVEKAFMIL